MLKPKFKMSKREMLEFNEMCNSAANECPQYAHEDYIEPRSIMQGTITAKQLVKHWRKCDTLFEYGYEQALDIDALEVFDRYKLYKSEKRKYKLENA